MPSKRKQSDVLSGLAVVTMPPELLDQLVKGPMTPQEVQAACLTFKKAPIERAMGAEMTHHLGYRHREGRPDGRDNHTTAKTVLTDDGLVRLACLGIATAATSRSSSRSTSAASPASTTRSSRCMPAA